MLCLFQCQSNSAFTRTYWSSRGTAGRNSRFKLFLLLILGAFSFVLSAILNSQAGYRCTLVPRLPFPVPRSPFPVPGISNIPDQKRKYERTKLENMKNSQPTRSHFRHARSCSRVFNRAPTRAKRPAFHLDVHFVFFVKRRCFSFRSFYGLQEK